MIVIDELILPTLESIEGFKEQMLQNAYKDDFVDISNLYYDFLLECFDADKKLQDMVFEKISDRYISFTILPIKDTDNLDSFSFSLVSEDDEDIKKRDELMYRNFCDICFGNIKPYYTRLLEFYEEHKAP